MKMLMIALTKMMPHLNKNISNYCLFTGLFLVLRFIFVKYGIENLLLTIAILLILLSFIIEISRKKPKKFY